MYKVIDSTGTAVRKFNTETEARAFKQIFGNSGWYILTTKY